MKKWLLLAGVLFPLVLFAAGCRTSYWEWSGSMANQSGAHVQPFNPNAQARNSQPVSRSPWSPGKTE